MIEPGEAPAANVVDLMEALETSVREARATRERHPSGGTSKANNAKTARSRRESTKDADTAKRARRRSA